MKSKLFSFGENWMSYVKTVDDKSIDGARRDLLDWFGEDRIKNKTVLDIGCGSGIHSLCFYLLKAAMTYSFDYDKKSVSATKYLWDKKGKPENWQIEHGSILNSQYLEKLGKYDIVYSWGVLHHTGSMWNAIRNAASLVKGGGYLFIAIYAKGPRYGQDLELKKKYNSSGLVGKKLMIWSFIWKKYILKRIKKRQNPFLWNERRERGMSIYYDVVDWIGGYPYEVASEEELTHFLKPLGFQLNKKLIRGEGACHCLLYTKEGLSV